MSPSGEHHFIPSDGLRCIWMTAGILSYQLCDRAYDCDSCPMDAAMRKKFSRQVDAAPVPQLRAAAPETLRKGFLYGRNHCWAQHSAEGSVRVGLEPGLCLALLAPKAVVFPSPGQQVQRGQTCLWIVLDGGTLPVEAPLGGTIRRNNRDLGDRPHLLNSRPFDEGWLFELEPNKNAIEEAELMEMEAVAPFYAQDEARLSRLLGNALQGNRPDVGVTLADGGQRLQNIADILGSSKYFSTLRKVYFAG